MAVKVYKSPYVYSQPMEYYPASTGQLQLGQLVKIDSTNTSPYRVISPVGLTSCTNTFKVKLYIAMKDQATPTTSQSRDLNFPVLAVDPGVTYVVDHATSETVISTTDIGVNYAVSSSGAATKGSTGNFRILGMYNTSDTAAQKLIGHFVIGSSAE